jgi:hypothetical protein
MRHPLFVFPWLAALSFLVSPLLADSVSGTIQRNGKSYPLQHAVGVRVASSLGSGGLVTRVAFSDAMISPEQLRSATGLLMRTKEGPIHGLTMEFSDDRSSFSLSVIHSEQNGGASLAGTMEQVQFTTHTAQQVAGTCKMAERRMGNLRLAADFQFAVSIGPAAAPQTGVAKKGAAVQSLASVQAYLAMRKAVQALDVAAIQKLARYPQDFQGPDGLKFAKMMKEDEPTGIVVVEATQGADTATLTVTGMRAGKAIRKSFTMQLKDGRWTTNNDNWEAN